MPPATRTTTRRPLVPAAVLGLLVLLVGFFAGAGALTGDEVLVGMLDPLRLFSLVVAATCAGLAHLVWRHDPANRIAVLALAVAASFTFTMVLERWALLGADRGWPGAAWALWGAQWLWVPALLAVPSVLALRFPDGRLPSPRWRRWEAGVLAALAAVTVSFALTPYGVLDVAPPVDLPHPLPVPGARHAFAVAMGAAGIGTAGCLAGFAARVRRAGGTERVQLQWGMAGVTGAALLVAASVALGEHAWLALAGVLLLPASIGVAVLRHGLFDVGRVLNRSLVYGSLTLCILLVYAVAVGLLGDVLGRTVGAPLVATGLVAVGVEPLRRRLQRVANHVVYGRRDDPYEVLARLGSQLATPPGRALAGVAAAVNDALGLRGAAVVVRGRTLASSGDLAEPCTDVALHDDEGVLRVSCRPGEQLSRRDRRLLADLSHQVAAAVRAAHLQGEVEASRARLVVAREEERRRIRADLHDGLGPTLAAIGLEIEMAALDVTSDPRAACARLDDATARVRESVRAVRSLVEGLRPPSLDELGLDGAVRELARTLGRGPVAIEVATTGDLDGLPAATSLAAYRIVGEALTNVLRHARATACAVSLRRGDGVLLVCVEDDGLGLGERTAEGVGIGSMRGRAAELGGSLALLPREGGGTTVRAELPLDAP